jgi:hypothetical protein
MYLTIAWLKPFIVSESSLRSDCQTLHASIIGYCRALVDCGLISAAQRQVLIAEAGRELSNWRESTEPRA